MTGGLHSTAPSLQGTAEGGAGVTFCCVPLGSRCWGGGGGGKGGLSEEREGMRPSVECRERSTLDAHLLAEERGGEHGYIRKSLRRGEGQHEGGRHSREWRGT